MSMNGETAQIASRSIGGAPGSLIARLQLLVIDVSPRGCLLESRQPLALGRVGTVRITVNERCYVEDVRVTRCEPVSGQGSTYHMGVEFLRIRRQTEQSLRAAVRSAGLALGLSAARAPRGGHVPSRTRKSKEHR
jgi:hypothetical protein